MDDDLSAIATSATTAFERALLKTSTLDTALIGTGVFGIVRIPVIPPRRRRALDIVAEVRAKAEMLPADLSANEGAAFADLSDDERLKGAGVS